MAFPVLRSRTLDDLSTKIQQEDQLRQLTKELLQDPASRLNYAPKNGYLFFKGHHNTFLCSLGNFTPHIQVVTSVFPRHTRISEVLH